jgi:hypothetical protein
MILNGDWNTNFIQEIVKLNELENLYLTFNLTNSQISNQKYESSLLCVIIMNKENYM